MPRPDAPLPLRTRWWVGLLCMVFGLMPLLAAFDVGPLKASDIHGPAWLGVATGGIFVAAGLAVLAQGTRLAMPLVGLLLLSMAVVIDWIGFGPGNRDCDGGVALLGFELWSASSGWVCRVPFAYGAVVMDAVLLLFVMTQLQKLPAVGWPWMQRVGEWAVLLTLSPLLALVVIPLVLRLAFEVVGVRLKTGQWPRNEGFIERQKQRGLLRGRKP